MRLQAEDKVAELGIAGKCLGSRLLVRVQCQGLKVSISGCRVRFIWECIRLMRGGFGLEVMGKASDLNVQGDSEGLSAQLQG